MKAERAPAPPYRPVVITIETAEEELMLRMLTCGSNRERVVATIYSSEEYRTRLRPVVEALYNALGESD